jgi:hypothetical protein
MALDPLDEYMLTLESSLVGQADISASLTPVPVAGACDHESIVQTILSHPSFLPDSLQREDELEPKSISLDACAAALSHLLETEPVSFYGISAQLVLALRACCCSHVLVNCR